MFLQTAPTFIGKLGIESTNMRNALRKASLGETFAGLSHESAYLESNE